MDNSARLSPEEAAAWLAENYPELSLTVPPWQPRLFAIKETQ